MAHIAHTHTLADGQRTGSDILDPNDPKRHWHGVDGGRTTSDAFGQGHIHLFKGQETSASLANEIPVEEGDNLIQNNALSGGPKGEMAMESKSFGGKATEVKEEVVNGVPPA